MKKLICYYGDSPVHVEGFSKECKRSCEGSLHILPRKSKTVTDGEYDHILEKYPWMKSKLKVIAKIGETDPRLKKAEAKAEAKAKVESQGKAEPKEEKENPSQGESTEGKKEVAIAEPVAEAVTEKKPTSKKTRASKK